MFKEINLSQTIPPNTVAITFRYQITSLVDHAPLLAWLADNVWGEDPIQLNGALGHVTVRLRTSQKLYYNLGNPELHLNLWIIGYRELRKHSC
jgi:hypothetical protein